MISIIIPAYNAESYIEETVKSIVNQTISNWELIIINDGSTDNTLKIIENLSKAEQRIKFINQLNTGVSAARNRGIEVSKGEYIAFLDADDIWLNNNLETKINALISRPEIHWVFSNLIYFNNHTEHIEKLPANLNKVNWLESLLLWKGEVKTTPSNIIIRKTCYTNGEIKFDEIFSTAADQEFCMQLASKYKGLFIDKALVRYRVLENSMSSNIAIMEKDQIGVYKKAVRNKYFKNFVFKQRCFSKLYWILAGSWWKDGNNKSRSLYFMFKAFITNPLSIFIILANRIK